VLAAVADLTAVSMTSLRRAEAALSEARRDPLTGAGNRRAFYERLELMLGRPRRPAALALFDLDGLKAVNDRTGHEAATSSRSSSTVTETSPSAWPTACARR
jgi:GGDEF domain-containing protein